MKKILSVFACSIAIYTTQAVVLPNFVLAAERGDHRSTNEGRRDRQSSRTDLSTGRKATSSKSEHRSEQRDRNERLGRKSNKRDHNDQSRHQGSSRQSLNHSRHSSKHSNSRHHNDRSRQSHHSHNRRDSAHNKRIYKKRKYQHSRNYRLGHHAHGHYGSKHRKAKHHGSKHNVYVGGGLLLAAVTHHAYCPDYGHYHEHDEIYSYVEDDYGTCFKAVYRQDKILHTQVAHEYCY